jgi:hypothetical protein
MTYDARTRDRYRLAVTATTAAMAAGAVVATGWLAGAAAQDHARVTAEQQARKDAVARQRYDAWVARYGDPSQYRRPSTVVRERPTRTRVTTRYVAGAAPSTTVGPGGTLTVPSRPAQTAGSVPPPPPPPPPMPAPSHGS